MSVAAALQCRLVDQEDGLGDCTVLSAVLQDMLDSVAGVTIPRWASASHHCGICGEHSGDCFGSHRPGISAAHDWRHGGVLHDLLFCPASPNECGHHQAHCSYTSLSQMVGASWCSSVAGAVLQQPLQLGLAVIAAAVAHTITCSVPGGFKLLWLQILIGSVCPVSYLCCVVMG